MFTSYHKSSNNTASVIKLVATMIFCVGTFVSVMLANPSGDIEKFNWQVFMVPEFISAISAVILFGFAEIIQIAHDIRSTVEEVSKNTENILVNAENIAMAAATKECNRED